MSWNGASFCHIVTGFCHSLPATRPYLSPFSYLSVAVFATVLPVIFTTLLTVFTRHTCRIFLLFWSCRCLHHGARRRIDSHGFLAATCRSLVHPSNLCCPLLGSLHWQRPHMYVGRTVSRCFAVLLRHLRRYITSDCFRPLVPLLMHSGLGYGKLHILAKLSAYLQRRFQPILNGGGLVILHWLRLPERVNFTNAQGKCTIWRCHTWINSFLSGLSGSRRLQLSSTRPSNRLIPSLVSCCSLRRLRLIMSNHPSQLSTALTRLKCSSVLIHHTNRRMVANTMLWNKSTFWIWKVPKRYDGCCSCYRFRKNA